AARVEGPRAVSGRARRVRRGCTDDRRYPRHRCGSSPHGHAAGRRLRAVARWRPRAALAAGVEKRRGPYMVQRRGIAILLAVAACGCGMTSRMHRAVPKPGGPSAEEPVFLRSGDLKWKPIIPDIGSRSTEIALMRAEPATPP